VEVVVTMEDLDQLHARVLPFVATDGPALNRVLVECRAGQVLWTGSDRYRLGRLPAGSGDGEGVFAVPARTMWLARAIGERREAKTVTFVVDGVRGTAYLPEVELPFDASAAGYPDLVWVDELETGEEVTVTLPAEDLFTVIHGAALRPQFLDDERREEFSLHVDSARGRLRAVASWDGHPDTSATVACAASRSARVGVNPDFLFEMAEAAAQEVLTLHLPGESSPMLRVESADGYLALLMPVRTGIESLRGPFEEMLAELLGVRSDELQRDVEGDYPVSLSDTHSLCLSLVEGDEERGHPHAVHVFAVLASNMEPTLELLTEVNDLNRNLGHARVYWADGNVVVGDELLLETLDAPELEHTCRLIANLAAEVAPLIEMIHG
jgi:type III secretion system-like peptide-binding chaperone